MALEILESLRHLERYDNEDALDLLEKLYQLYHQDSDQERRRSLGEQLVREGGTELLVKILIGFSTAGFFSSESIWASTDNTLCTIANLSNTSFLFAQELGKLDALQYLLAVLDHGPNKENLGEKRVYRLVRLSLRILRNAAKVPSNRSLLRQNNGVQKIAFYIRADDDRLKINSIMTLGHIIDEDESELIIDESGAREIMVKLLQGAFNSEHRRCDGFTPFEIAEGLTLIATCEHNKMKNCLGSVIRCWFTECQNIMALEILESLRHLESYDNEDALDLLKKLYQLYFQDSDQESRRSLGDLLVREGGTELLVKILIGFSTAGFFSSESIWDSTYYTLSTIWNLSDASFLFAQELGKLDALQYLLAVLDHGPNKEKLGEKDVYRLVLSSLSILHNASKVPSNRSLLRQNNGVRKIAFYTRADDDRLKMNSIMTLGHIIDEDESELIIDESGAVEIMVKLLQGAFSSEDRRCKGFSTFEIADGLTLIATCEHNKLKIYECGVVPICLGMMESEDFRDRQHATEMIWQLAFNGMLYDKLKENEALMDMLDTLSKDTNTAVSKAAHGAQWVIKKQGEEKSKAKPDSKSVKQTSGHIMISYQWDHQERIKEINKSLQNAGIKVWLDVEQMAGSTLQAMAEAVEKAYAVIICVSPKYKDSPNCRTEAEYTFQLRKEIIPLMMDQNYTPDGWLGALLGTKLWIDFSDDCNKIKQLIKAIKGHTPPDETDGVIAVSSDDQQTNASRKDPPLSTWTKEDVCLWLKENGLDLYLNVFAEYDGSLIYQMQKLQKQAPEFFYARLTRDMGFSTLTEILKFSRALEKTNLVP